MKVITQRDKILGVLERYKNTYKSFKDINGIYKKLQKLDLKTCSSEDVDTLIGNKSWTNMMCGECKNNTDWLLQLGDEPDYDSSTVYICKSCATLVGYQTYNP